MTKILFLPGVGASAAFWRPAADLTQLDSVFLAWPGRGNEPARPDVNGIDDLVAMVLAHMDEPVNIVAQSMGTHVAHFIVPASACSSASRSASKVKCRTWRPADNRLQPPMKQ